MEEKNTEIKDPREQLKPTGGKDELNLAEFPITLLSDRAPKGMKTIEFVIEPANGEAPCRKVTITASDAYGLPTAVDDEILVALIQLTKLKNGFTEPTVSFSRYEILELLGWADGGHNYRRVQESIKRWTGVTLYYENSWRNHDTKTWKNENFHIIDYSSFMDSETRRVHRARGQHELAFSSFTWGKVIFDNLRAGSLKRLDIDAYFSYSTSVAKRIYRFVDKRFWYGDYFECDLKEFAFERIGLSRNYNVAQIKDKLKNALDELSQSTDERAAFLEPLPPEERYRKLGKGKWIIRFVRKQSPAPPTDPEPAPSGLILELMNRGIRPQVAEELVSSNPSDFVLLRIEVFDWLHEPGNEKVRKKTIRDSATGYLTSSIRDRYLHLPRGFKSKASREMDEEATKRKLKGERKAASRRGELDLKREREDLARLRAYWESRSADEQRKLEEEALEHANPVEANNYRNQVAKAHNPTLKECARMRLRIIVNEYIKNILKVPVEQGRAG